MNKLEYKNSGYDKESYWVITVIILFIFVWTFLVAGINVTYDLFKPSVMINLIFIGCSLALVLLSYLIKVKSTVYWITSYSYKDALKMTAEKRLQISSIFYRIMGGTNLALVLYLVISMVLDFGMLLDCVVYFMGILGSSIYVTKKLREVV